MRVTVTCQLTGLLEQYADETAAIYASQLLEGTTTDSTVCVMSAPSAFVALKNKLVRLWLHLGKAALLRHGLHLTNSTHTIRAEGYR
jgi:hypothetical protein